MVIRQHALNQLERKRLAQRIEFQEAWVLGIGEEAQILKDGVRIVRGRAQFRRRAIREDSLDLHVLRELIPTIFVDHLVHHEHHKLPQRRSSR